MPWSKLIGPGWVPGLGTFSNILEHLKQSSTLPESAMPANRLPWECCEPFLQTDLSLLYLPKPWAEPISPTSWDSSLLKTQLYFMAYFQPAWSNHRFRLQLRPFPQPRRTCQCWDTPPAGSPRPSWNHPTPRVLGLDLGSPGIGKEISYIQKQDHCHSSDEKMTLLPINQEASAAFFTRNRSFFAAAVATTGLGFPQTSSKKKNHS